MPLIVTLAAGLGLALALGFAAARLRLPALVGYLLAGVLIGPHTPGFVADVDLALQLAELGVMLLMFGDGLHFSIDDLLAVRRIALPGAVVQMAVATLLGVVLAIASDIPILVRAASEEEAELLASEAGVTVVHPRAALSEVMTGAVLRALAEQGSAEPTAAPQPSAERA